MKKVFLLLAPIILIAGVAYVQAATVSVSANPVSVAPNNSSVVSWTSSGWNDSANVWCSSNAGITTGPTGSFNTGNLNPSTTPYTYTYNVTCHEPEGTISAIPCTIPDGESACDSSVTWTTVDLSTNPTEVTRNNPNNTHVSFATSGSNAANTVNYGASTFYLYHNSVLLGQSSIAVGCVSGDIWDGSKCIVDNTGGGGGGGTGGGGGGTGGGGGGGTGGGSGQKPPVYQEH
ncbi:MAG TPA: hypothetical protein VG694_00645 [Candidatus Paceibacterota bacterium]|nr:hypothetical protein [Candidatus Paceibacterota bacterium]